VFDWTKRKEKWKKGKRVKETDLGDEDWSNLRIVIGQNSERV
jgi:hypothetical protein